MSMLQLYCRCEILLISLFIIVVTQVAAMTSAHQQDVQNILASHAVEHSTSKLAELSSKVSTQEVAFPIILHCHIVMN